MQDLKSKKIAVLSGGRSGEREVSLRSGKNVFESLKKQGFDVASFDVEEKLISKLKDQKIDLVYIALHGQFGEDGTIQGMLEIAQIPYTGSKVLASALAMDKVASKKIFNSVGIPTPKFIEVNTYSDIKEETQRIKKMFPFPLVVKPTSQGSSLGVTIVEKEKDIERVLKDTVDEFKDVFIEEYIKGREVTVGVLGKDQSAIALPILELVSKTKFYDYKAKYTAGMTEFILPARIGEAQTREVQEVALAAHKALGCYGVSRVDMIIGPNNIPYVHDVNTIPGMTDQSDLPAQAKHAGISYDQLVVRILESAF